MIEITEKKNCCGCSACVQACPKQCIFMQIDEEGFAYPQVNEELCVHCNLCNQVCPIENAIQINKNNPANVTAYVGYTIEDEIREKSSSGGIFTALATPVLEKGGVVFGAAFDEDFMGRHESVTSVAELECLRGSKYLQSRIEKTYQEAEELLLQGRTVLFSGVACQIAGLYAYLGKDYDNLITVDVLCHGVPSPKVWERYVDEKETAYGAALRRTFFRSKKYGWKTYALSLEFSNDKAYEEIFAKDFFGQMFLQNICLRPSCHDCRFKGMDRPSDITIGDAWGVEKHSKEMDDNKGTSVILTHTEKGACVLRGILEDLCYKKVALDTALPPSVDSRKSVASHRNRAKFFKQLNEGKSIDKLVKLVRPSLLQRIKYKLLGIFKKIIKTV